MTGYRYLQFLDQLLLECLNLIRFEYSQIDGHAEHAGLHYFSRHDGANKKGCIQIIRIEGEHLEEVGTATCHAFPHGMDICNGQFAYTSYAQSSVVIQELAELLKQQKN